MKLVEEFTMEFRLKPPVAIGQGPLGMRNFYEIAGGEIRGERLNAKVLGGGGDWALAGSDGFVRLDVRFQAETDDGAFLYVHYVGLLEPSPTLMGALAAGNATDYGEYFYSNPRFETGDPRYAWLNTTFFVGQGRAVEGFGVGYRVFRPA